MSDPNVKLKEKFKESNRHANFGDILMRMHLQGFRCHENTVVEIANPITAFCGLNGTGKSTLIQLAAAAYQDPDGMGSHYIKNFLVVSRLDPNPFSEIAAVEFKFWQSDRSLKPLTLSRSSTSKRWQGYGRRIKRKVLFAGAGWYLPKIEQKDFIIRNAGQLAVLESSAIAEMVTSQTCKVLGQTYSEALSHTVSFSNRRGNLISVQRTGKTYSESHMGFGEARSFQLISALETLPDKSLVLIEEPEISLHPSAQFEFARYLVDVSTRKRHQIMLTTHSEFILSALPSESRIYLKRTENGIATIPGLTSLQAKSLMADGYSKALYILVEDECAKAILTEIIRRVDSDFLQSVGIFPAGDADTIATTVKALKNTGLSVAAVRDGDQTTTPKENIFKLPGMLAPEKELFAQQAIKDHLRSVYKVDLDDFLTNLKGVDHHEWIERLANRVALDKSALASEMARVYARNLRDSEIDTLITLLKEATRR